MKNSPRGGDLAATLVKGVAIGAANTVPGVSGGTIAVVTGIYDRLIEAIGDVLSPRWKTHLAILVPMLLGVMIGIAGFAWVIELGLERAPEQTFFVFVGLIAGSIPFIGSRLKGHPLRPRHLILGSAAFGLLVVQALLGEPPMSTAITTVSASTVLPLIAAGAIATATMIIPGVSGSFVLLVIGMYATFLQAVRGGNVPVLLVLVAGAAIGLVFAGKVMNILLRRFHVATYWVILGLVAGSIVGIWPGVATWRSALLDVPAAAVGVLLALLLGKRPNRVVDSPEEQS
jgi:putative membrane protein